MTSIVTKTGDAGMTGIIGGRRLSKTNPCFHACGTVDELNALIGVTLAEEHVPLHVREQLERTQHLLFQVGADLATPLESGFTIERMHPSQIEIVEEWICTLEESLPPITYFILPSGSRPGALLHQARTVCRRAERWVVAFSQEENINKYTYIYLNRFSDYLFLAARKVNIENAAPEMRALFSSS